MIAGTTSLLAARLRQAVRNQRRSRSSVDHSIQACIRIVRAHDAAAYLPGRLLPLPAQSTYWAVRAFWISTGLRFGDIKSLDWWERGVHQVFAASSQLQDEFQEHPIFHLLQTLHDRQLITNRSHFDNMLQGRRKDQDVSQYETLQDMIDHAELSCGSLTKLVLESAGLDSIAFPNEHEAAGNIGVCHGLTQQLRTSVGVLSNSGKLIIPRELTTKYNVQSPRYLFSALSMGDDACNRAFRKAVKDIVDSALGHLQHARDLEVAKAARPILLPGLASETFLQRLIGHDYNLTDRNLRHAGVWEHTLCGYRILRAYAASEY